jgi:hypothetical protein
MLWVKWYGGPNSTKSFKRKMHGWHCGWKKGSIFFSNLKAKVSCEFLAQ